MSGIERQRVVIQSRDRLLLQDLALLRIIDREQAKTIAGFGSTTRANTRLLALTRAGLLRRFFFATAAGGTKALYAVSREGAELADIPYRGPRRRNHEMLVADSFVRHQLAVNDIYCKLKVEIASHPDAALVRWLAFHEPLTPQLRLIPDGYFELDTPSPSPTYKRRASSIVLSSNCAMGDAGSFSTLRRNPETPDSSSPGFGRCRRTAYI